MNAYSGASLSVFPILSILHVCVEDWGSDCVLKPPKEFDPLPPGRAVSPSWRGRGGAGARSYVCGVSGDLCREYWAVIGRN